MMLTKRTFLVLGVVACALIAQRLTAEGPASSGSQANARAVIPSGPAVLDYVERTTQGAAMDAELPLLIVVHGLGDTPETFIRMFDDVEPAVRVVAPRAP